MEMHKLQNFNANIEIRIIRIIFVAMQLLLCDIGIVKAKKQCSMNLSETFALQKQSANHEILLANLRRINPSIQ